jgi:OmpA-OmpF porin, OOP family
MIVCLMFRTYLIFSLLLFLYLPLVAQDAGKAVSELPKNRKGKTYTPYVHPSYIPDEDKDGVPDGRDKCPQTPRNSKVTTFGCPMDTDFDNIFDYQDRCPTEPGPVANQGCPWGDTDKDGIFDDRDLCPETPGLPQFMGCPDTDNDGIGDSEDQCPTVPGIRAFRGCPPVRKDSDKDGVDDDDDICPDTPGSVKNRGCPEITAEEEKVLKEVFENLFFETAKAVIEPVSYPSLDKLAEILKLNTTAQLVVEGHTDDVGDDTYNLILSRNRADAVRTYLIEKGILPNRILTYGFGETRPIADNSSETGRQKNRRVELTLRYE